MWLLWHGVYRNIFYQGTWFHLIKIIEFEIFFFKICGNKDCCYTPWLTGNFNIGEIDSYTGPSQLGECAGFELMDDTMPLSMSK